MFNVFSDNLVGIDIGTSSVKVAEFKRAGNSMQLIKAAVLDYGFRMEEFADAQMRRIAIADTIRSALNKAGIMTKKVAISLSAEEVMTHSFEMPHLEADETEKAVKLEAQQIFYSDLRGMYLDYSSRDVKTGQGGLSTKGIIVTSQRQVVDDYIDILDKIGCETVAVDIASLANINCFLACEGEPAKESEVLALLDVGERSSKLSIIDAGRDDFIRDIKWGTADLVNAVSDKEKISFEAARKIIMSNDRSKTVERCLNSLAEELLDSIHYYEIRYKDKKVSTLYVTGGLAQNSSLPSVMADELSIEVFAWNALEKIQKRFRASVEPEEFPLQQGMRMATALGLALRVYD